MFICAHDAHSHVILSRTMNQILVVHLNEESGVHSVVPMEMAMDQSGSVTRIASNVWLWNAKRKILHILVVSFTALGPMVTFPLRWGCRRW